MTTMAIPSKLQTSEMAPFGWRLSSKEYADVQAATVREQRVNWRLVEQSNRIKRWAQGDFSRKEIVSKGEINDGR